jgi:hypothetical protein
MRRLKGLVAGMVIGALLGAAVAFWAQINLVAGLGVGLVIGLIVAFGFIGLPQQDKDPPDLFPE